MYIMQYSHGTIVLYTYMLVQQNTTGVAVSDCVVDNSDSEANIFTVSI